jgi:hypothetical protein
LAQVSIKLNGVQTNDSKSEADSRTYKTPFPEGIYGNLLSSFLHKSREKSSMKSHIGGRILRLKQVHGIPESWELVAKPGNN